MLGWWLPENVATVGGGFYLLYWSSAVAMLIVQMLMTRARQPMSARGARVRELVWALVPALMLLSLGVLSQRSPAAALAAPRAEVALEIPPASPAAHETRW